MKRRAGPYVEHSTDSLAEKKHFSEPTLERQVPICTCPRGCVLGSKLRQSKKTAALPQSLTHTQTHATEPNASSKFYGWDCQYLQLRVFGLACRLLIATFPINERVNLEFRAEAYDIFNHSNMYVLASGADANGQIGGVVIQGKKGCLGVGTAEGLSHDERRFGQFALRLHF